MNCVFLHGFIPDSIMKTVIIPIIKDKRGALNSSKNYRPVAITTVFSKVLESIVLNKHADCLITEDNQFGFKPINWVRTSVFLL